METVNEVPVGANNSVFCTDALAYGRRDRKQKIACSSIHTALTFSDLFDHSISIPEMQKT